LQAALVRVLALERQLDQVRAELKSERECHRLAALRAARLAGNLEAFEVSGSVGGGILQAEVVERLALIAPRLELGLATAAAAERGEAPPTSAALARPRRNVAAHCFGIRGSRIASASRRALNRWQRDGRGHCSPLPGALPHRSAVLGEIRQKLQVASTIGEIRQKVQVACQETAVEEGVVGEVVAEEAIANEAAAKEAVTTETATDESVADKAVAEEAPAKQAIADEAVTDVPVAEEAAAKETAVVRNGCTPAGSHERIPEAAHLTADEPAEMEARDYSALLRVFPQELLNKLPRKAKDEYLRKLNKRIEESEADADSQYSPLLRVFSPELLKKLPRKAKDDYLRKLKDLPHAPEAHEEDEQQRHEGG